MGKLKFRKLQFNNDPKFQPEACKYNKNKNFELRPAEI